MFLKPRTVQSQGREPGLSLGGSVMRRIVVRWAKELLLARRAPAPTDVSDSSEQLGKVGLLPTMQIET